MTVLPTVDSFPSLFSSRTACLGGRWRGRWGQGIPSPRGPWWRNQAEEDVGWDRGRPIPACTPEAVSQRGPALQAASAGGGGG